MDNISLHTNRYAMSTDKYLTPKSGPAFYYSCTQKMAILLCHCCVNITRNSASFLHMFHSLSTVFKQKCIYTVDMYLKHQILTFCV